MQTATTTSCTQSRPKGSKSLSSCSEMSLRLTCCRRIVMAWQSCTWRSEATYHLLSSCWWSGIIRTLNRSTLSLRISKSTISRAIYAQKSLRCYKNKTARAWHHWYPQLIMATMRFSASSSIWASIFKRHRQITLSWVARLIKKTTSKRQPCLSQSGWEGCRWSSRSCIW